MDRDPIMRRLRSARIARPLAILLGALLIWTPFYAAWADAITDAAQAGQLAGQTVLPSAPLGTADSNGNVTLYPNGSTPISLGANQLFPGATGNFSSYSSTYGSDPAMINLGTNAQTTLQTEPSYNGEAYRTVVQSNLVARPDLRNDPVWSQTDSVVNNLTAIQSQFSDCTTSTTMTSGSLTAYVPDYRLCEVVHDPGASCTLTNSYSATYHPMCEQDSYDSFYVYHPNGETAAYGVVMCSNGQRYARVATTDSLYWRTPGPGCETSDSGWVNISAWANGMSIGTGNNGETEARLTQLTPTSFRLERLGKVICGSDANTGATVCGDTATYVPYDPNTGNGGYYTIAGTNVGTYTWNGVDICGGASGTALYSATAATPATQIAYYDPIVQSWSGMTPQCQNALAAAQQGACTMTATCTLMPPVDANGCTTLSNGKLVCTSDLQTPPFPGVNPLCQQASFNVSCSGIYTGQMSCWTDINGVLQCPVNTGGNPDGCAQYRNDSSCGYISSTCLQGSSGSPTCYVEQQKWDCGYTTAVPTLTSSTAYNCVGPIRCLGTECVAPKPEQNKDFARAAALLQAAQAMQQDGSCTNPADPMTCTIFAGKPGKCKRAVGGIVDCCKSPGGVSMASYVDMLFAINKLDGAIMAGDNMQGTMLRGAWETLRDPVVNTWSSAKDWFSSAWNSMTGSTAPSTSELASQGLLSQFQQDMMKDAAQWVANTFGNSAANALFQNALGGAAVDNAGQVTGNVTFSPVITTPLAWLATAYMYYTIALLVINLIWQCTQDELQLGANRDLKLCHQVGSYCSQETLFGCLETQESYCCYNSPLSRIIQEQVRPQLGNYWGTPEAPVCTGIDLLTFGTIDWSQVNLDEWLGILNLAGKFPNAANVNMDSITGPGNYLNIYGSRPNASARAAARIGGTPPTVPPLDTTGIRDAATQQLR